MNNNLIKKNNLWNEENMIKSMEEKNIYCNKKYRNLLYVSIIMLANYVINSSIMLKALYLDDAAVWGEYIDYTFTQFVFNTASNKFRPVFDFFLYGVFYVAGTKIYIIGIINLIFATIVALAMYYIINKVSKNEIIGLLGAIMYLLSRFSYYNINQVFGLMEAMALLMAITILYLLYKYINIKDNKYYFLACILYILIPYVHERYIILFPLFLYAVVFAEGNIFKEFLKNKNIIKVIVPSMGFVLFFIIRTILFKGRMLDGTGGTNAVETFDVGQVVNFVISQIVYLLGINNGDPWLSGISWNEMRIRYQLISVMIASAMLMLFCISTLIVMKQEKQERRKNILNLLLFLLFIGLCIAASSITIRVEMRWIYVSYSATLIMLAYMLRIVLESNKVKHILKILSLVGAVIFFILSILLEHNYRSHYSRLYYWSDMLVAESLYEDTYDVYGKKLWDKKLVIYDARWGMTVETVKNVLRPLTGDGEIESFEVHVVNNLVEAKALCDENTIILELDGDKKTYTDITEIVKIYQFELYN